MNRDSGYVDYDIREVIDDGLVLSKEAIGGLTKLGEYYANLPKTKTKALKPWQVAFSMAGVGLLLTSCVSAAPGGVENHSGIAPTIGPEISLELSFGVIPTPEGIVSPDGEIRYPTETYCAPHLKICVAHQFDKSGVPLDPAIMTSSEVVPDLANNKVVLTGDLVAIPAEGYGEIKTDIDESGNTISVKGYVNREPTVMTIQEVRQLVAAIDLNDAGKAAVEAVLDEAEAKGVDVNVNFRQILNTAKDPSGAEKLVDMDERMWLRAGDNGPLAILTDKLEPFDKVELLSDRQIASLNVVDNGVDQDQFVMEVYPSTWSNNGEQWVSPEWYQVQEQVASAGERFTLAPDGTIQDGAKTVPGLSVDKNGVMTLQGSSSQVTISPEDVSFDDENGVSVKGYTLNEATGKWGVEVMGTSLTIENLDAKKWGNYSLIENPDGYYEMKDVQGNLIPEVKLFRDGTAELTYSSKKLAVAFQAISVGAEGQLSFGLWDYQNGEWSMAPGYTAEDVRAGEFADDYHKLVVIRGNDEIQKKLTDTIFMARDLYMNNTEGYRPESEFEGITVTYNFKTVENFDVRPKEWQMINYSRNWKALGKNGAYIFQPFSQNNEVVYDYGSTLSYARPIQVGLLGPGWFKVDVYNKGELSQTAYHAPIVAMNTDRSIAQASTLVDKENLSSLIPLLTKEKRGQIIPFLFSKIVPTSPYLIFSNKELMSFTSSINHANYVDIVGVPELDTDYPLRSFPREFSNVLLTLEKDPRY